MSNNKKNKIFVLGGNQYENLMYTFGEVCNRSEDFIKNAETYKLVLFHGGSDVNPIIYKDISPKMSCYYDVDRDKLDMSIFKIASLNKIPMIGICRGAQFLNVMAGGKLMHHITGHTDSHMFSSHKDESSFLVSSTHHQMIIPARGSHLIGWSTIPLSSVYIGNFDEKVEWTKPETEAIILPRINACGVQFHPEMMGINSFGRMWFNDLVRCFIDNPMVDFISEYTPF
jgi:gamma-glutamyl-gamma-aminobutyrate hydrolase PuuD